MPGRLPLPQDMIAALTDTELDFLRLNIEKRHVIGHNLGIADEVYSEAVQQEEPGQTLTLLAAEIRRFGAICQAVVGHL